MSQWRTAGHEASHATCAVLLRATCHAGPVTIIPDGYDGICYAGRAPRPRDPGLRPRGPYASLPAGWRRYHETGVMVSLAGWTGELLYAGRGDVAGLRVL